MVRVSVVLLGDIGRSPRMQYHVVSLTSEGYDVDFIGFTETKPIKKILENDKVRIRPMWECPSFQKHLPRVVGYALKAIWQAVVLFCSLLFKRKSDMVLVQSPPAIPTLVVSWLYCRLANAKLIVDWHNYAHTNMAFTLGENHVLVRVSKWVEGNFGRRADNNLCVTKAMQADLLGKWGIEASVLYDRPFESFAETPLEVRHDLYMRLGKQYKAFAAADSAKNQRSMTAFTSKDADGSVSLREDRPAILISSTSWTEDEDFGILLSALIEYEQSEDESLPQLVCVITGKGPMKEQYLAKMASLGSGEWRRVRVETPWLEADDYPLMLGSADLGVSLHLSTSGLDLPMKVVDMFGCGLPVAAYNFPALKELVEEGKTGMVFENSNQLANKIQDWFRDFPDVQAKAKKYRKTIEANFQNLRWHENWVLNASRVFQLDE